MRRERVSPGVLVVAAVLVFASACKHPKPAST